MAAVWENPKATLENLDHQLSKIETGSVDLIVLPETFSTGFTNSSKEYAELMNGPTVNWMRSKAAITSAVVAGSLIISDNSRCYNRLIFVHPKGKLDGEFFHKSVMI